LNKAAFVLQCSTQAFACMLVNFSEMLKDRQKGMSDYWSAAPADSTLAAHCRPNGNSALPFKGAASDKNTSLLVAEEVTRPIEQFGHIVARPRSSCCRKTSLIQRILNRSSRLLPATVCPRSIRSATSPRAVA
jgi:hypothetical protein